MNIKRFASSLLLCLILCFSLVAKEKSKINLTSDDALYDLVRRKLANDPDVRGGNLMVEVHNGVVTIKGIVEKEKVRVKAEKITLKVNGVKKVDNQLTISPTRN